MLPQHAHYKFYWLRYYQLWRKYADRTMAPRKTYMGNLLIADYSNRNGTLNDGCFVECGTWRGGMSFGLTEVLSGIRECHYFDSYEGLPPGGEWDGDKARIEQSTGALWHNNNTAEYDDFLHGMRPLHKPGRALSAHKGWFEDTLPQFKPERPISVLRLDGDWYEPTVCILDNLFDHVMQGGLIMIDDYYDWDGCTRGVHDFLSKRKLTERIRQSRYGGLAYILKLTPTD